MHDLLITVEALLQEHGPMTTDQIAERIADEQMNAIIEDPAGPWDPEATALLSGLDTGQYQLLWPGMITLEALRTRAKVKVSYDRATRGWCWAIPNLIDPGTPGQRGGAGTAEDAAADGAAALDAHYQLARARTIKDASAAGYLPAEDPTLLDELATILAQG